jgi:hypothetical protein
MGIHFRLTDIVPNIDRLLYGLTVGFMMNTSRRTALGAEAFGGIEGLLRGGVALRWRRWLRRRSSLDLALGVHLFGDTLPWEPRARFADAPGQAQRR